MDEKREIKFFNFLAKESLHRTPNLAMQVFFSAVNCVTVNSE